MCLSAPSMPSAPPPPQAVKPPDLASTFLGSRRARSAAAMGGGSLLTGPSGVANVATAKNTLLGG